MRRPVVSIEEHSAEIAGQPVAWLSAEAPSRDRDEAPVLYLHGVPTSAELWTPFLARTGGIAVDLPGFGRSGKRGDLDYTLPGFVAFLESFTALLGLERVRLVAQDWGVGIGLAWAQRHPEAIERLVIVDGVPLLPGYTWHRTARLWRTPGVGELIQGSMSRFALRRLTTMDERTVQLVWRGWDQGTQRAILHLYRSADPAVLAAAGADLGAITAPALVLWGAQDPYVSSYFAQEYADALGGPAEVELLEDAGHWPWIERPDVIDRVADFLAGLDGQAEVG